MRFSLIRWLREKWYWIKGYKHSLAWWQFDNKWHHICIMKDPKTGFENTYIDGDLERVKVL